MTTYALETIHDFVFVDTLKIEGDTITKGDLSITYSDMTDLIAEYKEAGETAEHMIIDCIRTDFFKWNLTPSERESIANHLLRKWG